MSYNPSKSEVLHITRRKTSIKTDYMIHKENIITAKTERYTGVSLTDNLSWNALVYIDQTTKNANNSITFL